MASSEISVIVPVYKSEQHLDKCMQSILHSTFSNIEVILIDDGSPNGAVCDGYAANDNRVRVVRHGTNKGLSAVRNEGVRQAKSPYISFVDSDDWIMPSMLDDMYQLSIKHSADIVSCGVTEYIGGKPQNAHEFADTIAMDGKEALRLSLLSNSTASHTSWGKLYKRELFKGVTYPERRFHEDAATTYLLYQKAKKVIHTKKQLYCYTINNEGIANSGFKPASMDKLVAADEIINFAKKHCPEFLDYAFCFKMVSALRIAADFNAEIIQRYPNQYQEVRAILHSTKSKSLSSRHKLLLILFKYCKPAFHYIWKRRLSSV